MKSIHIASFLKKDFERICQDFPQYKEWLENISTTLGPKTLIEVNDLKNDEVSRELYDAIFYQAYANTHYMREGNFFSVWCQLKKILELPKSQVSDILEVGKGIGFFSTLLSLYDYQVTTLDVNEKYQPDIVGDILNLPWEDNSFDCACAFEVLEHLPSFKTLSALKELVRVSRRYVYISLPCQKSSIHLNLAIRWRERILNRLSFNARLFTTFPSFPLKNCDEDRLLARPDKHNPHYWEVGRQSFPKKRIRQILTEADLDIIQEFHNPHHPYHWFLLCQLNSTN